MREQSNGLAGPNIAAGGGRAVSSKELLGLMRICSVPKASFPVLQERLVLSVDDMISFVFPRVQNASNRTAEAITSANPTHAFSQASNRQAAGQKANDGQEAKRAAQTEAE